jgi:hypothetical protein
MQGIGENWRPLGVTHNQHKNHKMEKSVIKRHKIKNGRSIPDGRQNLIYF